MPSGIAIAYLQISCTFSGDKKELDQHFSAAAAITRVCFGFFALQSVLSGCKAVTSGAG